MTSRRQRLRIKPSHGPLPPVLTQKEGHPPRRPRIHHIDNRKSIASRSQPRDYKIRLRHRFVQRAEKLRLRKRTVRSRLQLCCVQQIDLFDNRSTALHLCRRLIHDWPDAAKVLRIFTSRRRLQPAHIPGLNLRRQTTSFSHQRVPIRSRHLRLRRARLSRGNRSHYHPRHQQSDPDSHLHPRLELLSHCLRQSKSTVSLQPAPAIQTQGTLSAVFSSKWLVDLISIQKQVAP